MNEQLQLLQWIDPVVVTKNEFLIDRPLMTSMDLYYGPGRLLGLMEVEKQELDVELLVLKSVPRKEWNGARVKAAAEAADVLVFAGAMMAIYGLKGMSSSQRDQFFGYLKLISRVQDDVGIPIQDVAVAIIDKKNGRYNYRKFAFQELKKESLNEAEQRFKISMSALKLMRKENPDGLLTDEVLSGWGYVEEQQGQNPAIAYQFLSGIVDGIIRFGH